MVCLYCAASRSACASFAAHLTLFFAAALFLFPLFFLLAQRLQTLLFALTPFFFPLTGGFLPLLFFQARGFFAFLLPLAEFLLTRVLFQFFQTLLLALMAFFFLPLGIGFSVLRARFPFARGVVHARQRFFTRADHGEKYNQPDDGKRDKPDCNIRPDFHIE